MEPENKNNLQGIFLMVISMAAFAVADTLIKVAAVAVSPSQVMFLLIAGSLIMFASLARLQGEVFWDRQAFAPVLLTRYAAELSAVIGMVMALAYVPLSTVGAVLQATPVLVALGAILFIGEQVSWRRWSGIIAGFVGVLLVVQPSSDGFDANVTWAIISAVGLSVRDLTTRLSPPNIGSARLSTYTMIAALPFSVLWVVFSGEPLIPRDANWLLLFMMVFLGSVGYLLLVVAIRASDISAITPFRYSRLIFMLILGYVIFDESPNALMLCGAGLIVASGLYIMWRENIVKNA